MKLFRYKVWLLIMFILILKLRIMEVFRWSLKMVLLAVAEGAVCVYPRNLEETLTILGEKGTVVIGGSALNKVLVWQFADEKDDLAQMQAECNNDIDNVYGWGHTPLYVDFIESIQQNRKLLLLMVWKAKKGMAIILHAYLSSRLQQRIIFGKQDVDMVTAIE